MRKLVGPVLLILLVCEIVAAVLIVQAAGGFSTVFNFDVNVALGPERRQEVPAQTIEVGPNTSLVVENDNGLVEVTGAAGTNQVVVNATKVVHDPSDSAFDRLTFEAYKSGNNILVKAQRANKPFQLAALGGDRVEIHITVPAYMVANVTTNNGSITARNLDSANARHRFKSDNGRINLEQIKAAYASADTSNGSISLSSFNGTISAESSNGRIEARNSGLIIELVKTSNGSIDLEGKLLQAMAGSVESDNGSVRLNLDQSEDIRFDITTGNGSINFNRSGASFQVQERHHLLTNGTGPTLRIKSNNGSVTVN